MELKERTEGRCYYKRRCPIPYVRYHFLLQLDHQTIHYYVYQHRETLRWFVYFLPWDSCLRSSRWSTTVWKAFQLAFCEEAGKPFRVSREMVEEMEGMMGSI